jgi:hypothetical protein
MKAITLSFALEQDLQDIFQLPLSEEAYMQFCEVNVLMQSLQINNDKYKWKYIWVSGHYSSVKAYKHLTGNQPVHLVFHCLWASTCQSKYKVLF